MNRWLKKIQNSQDETPSKPTKSPFEGLEGVVTGAFEEKHDPSTAPEWLDWITERCPLVPEDLAHLAKMLCRLHPRLQQRLAARYVDTWRAAAGAEPKSHRKDNAGRRAANMVVTRLLAGQGSIQ